MADNPWLDQVLDLALAPALWLSVLIVLVTVALLFGWRGGSAKRVAVDLLSGLVGAGVGQIAGALLGVDLLRLGQSHTFAGLVGMLLGIFFGRRWYGRSGRRK